VRKADAICVFTLHRVTDARLRVHDLSWPSFRRFLRDVERAPGAVIPGFEPHSTGPSIVLTFDDATAGHKAAAAALRAAGLSGVFFVPTSRIGAVGHLTAGEIEELAGSGHAIGSHADRHVPLATLTAGELDREVERSSVQLSDLLGVAPRYFAPPGGVANPRLPSALEKHGFVASRSMRWGIHRPDRDPWDIPCIPVTEVTLARGWVHSAMTDWELPHAMRAAWLLKRGLPRPVAGAVRRAIHGAAR